MRALSPKDNLPDPDARHLLAAEGWLELGDHCSANEELERIEPQWHTHPAVLNVRWSIYTQARQWSAAFEVAQELVRMAPEEPSSWINRSYVLHEMKRTKEAWDHLLPVWERFPCEPVIAYNLACYACQMGELAAARHWLTQAIAVGSKQQILSMARQDPDLEPMRTELTKF